MIVLSAVGEEREKVAALDAGADDYVDQAGRDRRAARPAAGGAAARRPLGRARDRASASSSSTSRSARSRSRARPSTSPRTSTSCCACSRSTEGKLMTHRALLTEVWGPGYARRVEPAARQRLAAAAQDRARPRPPALPADRAGRRLPARRPGAEPAALEPSLERSEPAASRRRILDVTDPGLSRDRSSGASLQSGAPRSSGRLQARFPDGWLHAREST